VPAGYTSNKADCNDKDATINPNAKEICDGIDNNCNGKIDDGATTTFYEDADKDGFGNALKTKQDCSAPLGFVSNNKDCNDSDKTINPSAIEVCDEIDNNCNTKIDEGGTTSFYRDKDGDGFGDAANTAIACDAPTGYVNNKADCNDADKNIHPDASEICDGLDNNCNTKIDDNCTPSGIEDEFNVQNQKVKVFPNPSAGIFTISVEKSEIINPKSEIIIYNVLGEVIYQSEIKNPKSEINLSGQSKGIYFLQIITDKEILNRKIVLE